MTPFSILTDSSTGDIDLSQGLRFTADLRAYVVQRLDENLSFFMGEWFLDVREGVPYWQHIIGAKPDLGLLDTLYRRAILRTVGVAGLTNLTLSFDRQTRKLAVRFIAILVDGTAITEADLARKFLVSV